MSAKPVSPLVLAEEQFLLAKDGGQYSLYSPLDPDDFGVVAHKKIETGQGRSGDLKDIELHDDQIHALLQHLGVYIEKCAALEAALQKAGG